MLQRENYINKSLQVKKISVVELAFAVDFTNFLKRFVDWWKQNETFPSLFCNCALWTFWLVKINDSWWSLSDFDLCFEAENIISKNSKTMIC